MVYRRLLFKVAAAFLLGLYLTISYLEQDLRFISIVRSELKKQFRSSMGVRFSGEVTSVDLLGLTVHIKNAHFVPIEEEGWSWKSEEFKLSLSWLFFVYHKKFGLDIDLKNYEINSGFKDGQLGMMSHIKKVVGGLQGMPVPLTLRSIVFKNAALVVKGGDHLEMKLRWNGQLDRVGSLYKSRLYFVDGSLSWGKTELASGISGLSSTTIRPGIPLQYRMSSDLQMIINHLPKKEKQCTLQGSWIDGQGACVLNNYNYSFHIDPLRTYSHGSQFMCQGHISFPVSYISRLLGPEFLSEHISGTCDVAFLGDPSHKLSGTITVDEPHYDRYGVKKILLSFLTDCQTAYGALTVEQEKGRFAGPWQIDLTKKTAKADLVNHTPWQLDSKTYWEIPSHEGRVSLSVNEDRKTHCDYRIALHHTKTDSTSYSKGSSVLSSAGLFHALGQINQKTYSCAVQLAPFKPLSALYKDKDEKVLFKLEMRPPAYKQLEALISYDLIRQVIGEFWDYDLAGQGTLKLSGTYKNKMIKGHLESKDVTIRLPETYNFISSVQGDCAFDTETRSAQFKDLAVNFHKGSLASSQGRVDFNEKFEPTFIHFPLAFRKCFFNWQEDLFAVASGALLLQKRSKTPYTLDGFVTIDKGQFKENPLSKKGQKEVTQFIMPSFLAHEKDLKLSLFLKTRDPLYIKTPQLQSRAVIDLELSNTVKNPELLGQLKLLGGMLYFPYKPLYITTAELHFFQTQTYDPLIELVAQGTFKKYGVNLAVTGSVKSPQITLSSTPALSEEQIISLLFTGSSEESLNILVPTLVMRNIESFVFGPASSPVDEYFNPLKRIRIVPSFTDQTGRGGFRGALEIDVSDQLHAKIQKNFSLSEDTYIEVEYFLSDDVSLKMMKDERSDLGAEVEMRFKF